MKSKVAIAAAVAALLLGCSAAQTPAVEIAPAEQPSAAQPPDAEPEPDESGMDSAYESPEAEAHANAGAAEMAEQWLSDDYSSRSIEPPVRLSLQDKAGPAYSTITYLVIQSTVDEVAVNAVEVNRGNCIALMTLWEPGAHYPTHKEVDSPIILKFGGELRLQPSCRAILEAKVATSMGDYEFSFADAY